MSSLTSNIPEKIENNSLLKNQTENTENTENTMQSIENKSLTNPKLVTKCKILCSIRRIPETGNSRGEDFSEKIWKIGASLDRKTKGNLKGVSGDLELLFMPEMIGLSHNDPKFREGVQEYWSNIGRVVPADENYLKEHERGIPLEIVFTLIGTARKEKFNALIGIESKLNFLNECLLIETDGRPVAKLDYESTSDYLLLNYCLKYSKVAKSIEYIYHSAKIEFYIYEKSKAISNQLSLIDLRHSAMDCYKQLENDSTKTNGVLLIFNKNPHEYDSELDKLLEIDSLYNRSKSDMETFVKYIQNKNWKMIYIINEAVKQNKLRNPNNSTVYYYNDIVIGSSLDDACAYLLSDDKGKIILNNLKQELDIK